jgi:DNA (cytosine-5)-methyltransferase 1
MRTLSLFSGIGGLDLGLERAGFKIVAQCEKDPYCRRVLAKHWPGVPCHDNVTTLDPTAYGPLDAIVGGFPCQDVSNAGHRAGLSGSRSGLYGELVRCLRVARPRIGILENVAALLARGMGTVLGDLAAIGYDAEWDCIPASAVGAPHRRDRVFIVAHRREERNPRPIPRFDFGKAGQGWSGCQADLLDVIRSPFSGRGGIPKPLLCGMDDGSADWVDRVGACGNAVMPQVAEVVGRAVLEAIGVAGD